MQYTSKYVSPIGDILLASDGAHLTGLWFEKQKYFADTLSNEHEEKNLPVFDETKHWLDLYFSGADPGFMPPLRPAGSPFRREVWDILLQIPRGSLLTYKEIADKITAKRGFPRMSAQAAGGAVGHNPISILIPCHRVVGSDGSLTGYAGGNEKKIALLKLEGAYTSRLKLPKKGADF